MSASLNRQCTATDRSPMSRRTRMRRAMGSYGGTFAVALLGASLFIGASPSAAGQPPVGLGTAESFAVLAGSGITNTGPTTITGDVGTFPTPTETGFGSVVLTGTNHAGDAVTQGAKQDLLKAYNDAAGRNPVTNVPVELGGKRLLPGVYTSGTLGLTGTLTLDAQGDPNAEFIFKAGSTLITASASRVVLVNGAQPCNVVWQIGSSATFNTGTRFVGNVLAHTSITAQTAATFQGRLLARNGAVTLDTNTITRARCATGGGGGGGGGTTSTTISTTSATAGSNPPATVAPATPGTPGTPTTVALAVPGGPTADTPATSSRRSPDAPWFPGAPATPATPSTPSSSPPLLAFTGVEIAGLLALALTLMAAGTAVLVARRRSNTATKVA